MLIRKGHEGWDKGEGVRIKNSKLFYMYGVGAWVKQVGQCGLGQGVGQGLGWGMH